MEPLTWTGSLAGLNIIFLGLAALLALAVLAQILVSFVPSNEVPQVNPDGTLARPGGISGLLGKAVFGLFALLVLMIVVYIVAGIFMGPQAGIFGGLSQQMLPVWVALIVTFAVSIQFKRRLGLYGKLFDSTVGMIGFAIVMFWVFTGIFGGLFDMLVTHDSLSQVSGMKNKLPGTRLRSPEEGEYPWFCRL